MKKITSIIIALAAMITTVSCTKGAGEQSSPAQTYVAERLSVAGYKKEKLSLPEGMNQVYSFMPYNGCNDYLLLGSGTKTPEFWHADGEFSEFETVEFSEFDIGVNYDLDTANDGTVVVFVVHADYGDLPPISLYEYPEGYDEEIYDNAAEYTFMIKTFSADGKLLSEKEVEDFGVEPAKTTSIRGVYSDGELVIAEISGAYEMFDINGKHLGELTTDMGDIDSIGHSIDGGLICAVTYTEEETDKMKLCGIASDGRLTDFNNTIYDFEETVQDIQPSTGEYSVLVRTRTSIYGIKADDSEMISLFGIMNSGVNTEAVKGFLLMDGKVAVMENDHKSYKVNFKKYIPRTEEEMANLEVITLGIYGENSGITEAVTEWNDEGKDFLIEIKKYSDEWGKYQDVSKQIHEDVLSDNIPDIICFANVDGIMCGVNFLQMDALDDMYTYMDKEDKYNREYFIPNVLKCCEYDNSLAFLPNRLNISLDLVAKTKFVGDASDWSISKYIDIIVDPPIDMTIKYDSKRMRMQQGVSWEDWVDFENGTCNFLDEDFIRFLNWCNEAEAIESEDEPWIHMTDEELQEYFNSPEQREKDRLEALKYIEDRAIFSHEWLNVYEDYTTMTKGKFNSEPITYVEGASFIFDGCLAITKTSKHKEQAWEFIKSRISDEYYSSTTTKNNFRAGFPVTKTGLEMFENCQRTNYTDYSSDYYNEDLRDYVGLLYYVADSEPIRVGKITDEDVAAVNKIIETAKPLIYNAPTEAEFYDIGEEEIDRFFRGGCTAEQCAEAMQNRLEIYLSEHSS